MKHILKSLTIALLIILSACSGHLYNQGNYDLAQKATETFNKVELEKSIDKEFALLDTLLKKELEAVEAQATAQRDARLWQIIASDTATDSYEYLAKQIDSRIQQLIGDLQKAKDYRSKSATVDSRAVQLEQAKDVYKVYRKRSDPSAECKEGMSQDAIKTPDALPTYLELITQCTKYEEAKKAREAIIPEGLLGTLNAEILAIEKAKKDIEGAIKTSKDELKRAKEDYESKVAPKKPATAKVAKELREKLNDLESKVDVLDVELPEDFQQFKLLGKIEKLKKQKESVDQLLNMVIENPDTVNADLSPKAQSALKFASYVNEFQAHIDSMNFPQVSKLLLESEFLKISIQNLNDQVSIADQKLDWMKKKRGLMESEMSWLLRAKDASDSLKAHIQRVSNPGNVSKFISYMSIINVGDSRSKQLATYAMTYYATSWTLARIEEELIDYQIIHLDHVTALNSSVSALKQWNSLIKIPLNQILQWEAQGIKSEQLSGLIQALGFAGLIAK